MYIRELSQKTGVSLRSLRYYEEKEILRPARSQNGYRHYTESDVELVRTVQVYLSLGFSTEEIASYLSCSLHEVNRVPCLKNAIRVCEEKLTEIHQQMKRLQAGEAQLQSHLADFKKMLQKGDKSA